jgi:hypothetical protein
LPRVEPEHRAPAASRPCVGHFQRPDRTRILGVVVWRRQCPAGAGVGGSRRDILRALRCPGGAAPRGPARRSANLREFMRGFWR